MRKSGVAGPLGLAVVIVAAALTACSTSGAGAGANGPCDSPGVTADQVKFGFVFSDTGTGSEALSSARLGVDARIGLVNEEGGVKGRHIIYDWRDDAASPSTNVRVTQALSSSTFGLVGVTSSSGGSLDALAKEGVPYIGLTQPSYAKYPNVFANVYDAAPETIGRYFLANGGTKVAMVSTGGATFTVDLAARYRSAFESIGLQVAPLIPFAASADSPARVAQQIADSGANALMGFTTVDDLAAIVQATRQANLALTSTVSTSGYDRGVLASAGPALSGVSFPVYFRPFEAGGPAIDRYRAAMARFAPQAVQPEEKFAMYGYIYADMFVRGLELAGDCPTREGFMNALRNVTDYDAGGLIEPTNLRTNPTTPLQCAAFVQVNPAGDAFRVVRERLCANGQGT
ncbi:ABC transporter substrate-binding protein [Parafrankia discariae]|uniref:ABC transporter substrate-binding protein n=1 Tax=Parafrankia discariae TaxID=365528 RepID=UPI0003AA94FD|nr:ABC transporter substrate-binding protein [Parafrankia discariae]